MLVAQLRILVATREGSQGPPPHLMADAQRGGLPRSQRCVTLALMLLSASLSQATHPHLVTELLPNPIEFATKDRCSANFTDVVGLTVPSWMAPPISDNYAVSLRVRVNLPRQEPAPPPSRYGYNRGGNSGSLGTLFGVQGQFYVGMTDTMRSLRLAIPGIPNLYNTMGLNAGGGMTFSSSPRAYQQNINSAGSDLPKKSTDDLEFDVTVIRSGTTISACVNGQEVVAPTQVDFWNNGTAQLQPMAGLPYSERDGEIYYGWRVPHLWGPTGGQPPAGPTFSIPGTYVHSRYSTQSYDTCVEAETAMSDSNTLPANRPQNGNPTVYLASSLGSSFYIEDEPEFTLTITDPDGDYIHATVTLYGRPPEECNWPRCDSKTVHLTAVATDSGASSATTRFRTSWKLPGRYIVRVSATDHVGGHTFQDVPFNIYKIGDTNKTAGCCRYNSEAMVYNQQLMHQRTFEPDVPSWMQVLYDYGILTPPFPTATYETLTCKGLHIGGPRTGLQWYAYQTKTAGNSVRFIMAPTGEGKCDVDGNPYSHPMVDYVSVQPESLQTDGGSKSCGCTSLGTQALFDMGQAFDKVNQFYMHVSNGRFSFHWTPDDLGDESLEKNRGTYSTSDDSIETDAELYAANKYGTDGAFYRHYLFYQQMDPGSSMSGVGGGKKSRIAGCDFGVARAAWMITSHEMGHAFDAAHAEMWTNVDTKQLALKDPGASQGEKHSEYMDHWAIMGDGLDFQEMDKLKLGWIADYETLQILNADRDRVSSTEYSLFPTDRAESKGNLMVLKIEMDADNLMFGCNFRQMPGQPGTTTRMGEDGGFTRDRSMNSYLLRGWIQGFTCMRVDGESRRLSRNDLRIDFNVLDGDYPDALPESAGQDPESQSTVGLGAGKTWYHREGKFSFSVLNIGPSACSRSPLYPVYDEYGIATFECASVRMKTEPA